MVQGNRTPPSSVVPNFTYLFPSSSFFLVTLSLTVGPLSSQEVWHLFSHGWASYLFLLPASNQSPLSPHPPLLSLYFLIYFHLFLSVHGVVIPGNGVPSFPCCSGIIGWTTNLAQPGTHCRLLCTWELTSPDGELLGVGVQRSPSYTPSSSSLLSWFT